MFCAKKVFGFGKVVTKSSITDLCWTHNVKKHLSLHRRLPLETNNKIDNQIKQNCF